MRLDCIEYIRTYRGHPPPRPQICTIVHTKYMEEQTPVFDEVGFYQAINKADNHTKTQ